MLGYPCHQSHLNLLLTAIVLSASLACSSEENEGTPPIVVIADEPDTAVVDAGIAMADAASQEAVDAGLTNEATRMVLHEVFTGSNCGPCLESDENLKDVLEANPGRYTVIKYQIGSDPYISREAVQRRMMYLPSDAETYSIPFIHVDGVNGFHPNEINNDEGYRDENFDEFAAVPSQMEMEVAQVIDEQTVDIELTIEPLVDYPSESLVLYIAIIENVTYNNVGTNGQTEFHYVFKKMLPDQDGEAIAPLIAGEPVTISRSYTFRGDYDPTTGIRNQINHNRAHTVEEFADLAVVVFVQDMETLQVHQSAWDAPADPMPMGRVEGLVTDSAGTPLADLPMTSCDDSLCINGMTDATGHYRFSGLGQQPRKMEVIAPEGMLDLIYVQEVGPQYDSVTVGLVDRVGDPSPWSSSMGGTNSFAGGALDITVEPDSLEFPLGAEELASVEIVPLGSLPPYVLQASGPAPWLTENAEGHAFLFNPTHLVSSSPVSMTVNPALLGMEMVPEGTVYNLYTVDPDTAIAEAAGQAVSNADGLVISDEQSTVTNLTTLILVRQPVEIEDP